MSDERFDIVFRGDIREGFFLQKVRADLAKRFQLEEQQVLALFSGRPHRLKGGLDVEAAIKYQAALEQIGLQVERVVCAAAKPVKAAEKASVETSSTEQNTAASTTHTGDWSIKPAGSDLLESSERATVNPVTVDIDHLSVRNNFGNLVDEEELQRQEAVEVDLSGLEIEALGELLTETERARPPLPEVEVEHLSIAPVGSRIGQEQAAPPPAPDTSHLTLQNER